MLSDEIEKYSSQIDSYVSDVLSGKIVSGKPVILACKRYKRDMKEAKKKGLYFDHAAAIIFIQFIECLPHVKGKQANEGKLLLLEPFQKFIIWNLFGWKWIETGYRRFRHAYVEMAKKNAKSTLVAAILMAMFVLDNEAGAEIYAVATTTSQANEVYEKTAVRMWRKALWLQHDIQGNPRITKTQYQLNNVSIDGHFMALSGDKDTMEGKFTHGGSLDEYHVHKTDDLVNNMVSGSVTRTQPLIMRITTAGVSRKVPCFTYREDCMRVLDQITHDETLFIMIFTVDEEDYYGDNWMKEKSWPKANPLWASNPEVRAGVRAAFQEARRSVTKEVDFKTKHLNIWTDSAKTWITADKYMKSAGAFDITNKKSEDALLESLKGRECYGGLDLSKTHDFTAFTLVFPMEDGSFKKIHRKWIPEERAASRKEHHYHNFLKWQSLGLIKFTDGEVIDNDVIKMDILELCKLYDVKVIASDRWNWVQLAIDLSIEGVNMIGYGQGPVDMSPAIMEMENLILQKRLHHSKDPVEAWMMSNVLLKTDPKGNRTFDKSAVSENIDGPVSTAMAIGQYLKEKAKDNTQETWIV